MINFFEILFVFVCVVEIFVDFFFFLSNNYITILLQRQKKIALKLDQVKEDGQICSDFI